MGRNKRDYTGAVAGEDLTLYDRKTQLLSLGYFFPQSFQGGTVMSHVPVKMEKKLTLNKTVTKHLDVSKANGGLIC